MKPGPRLIVALHAEELDEGLPVPAAESAASPYSPLPSGVADYEANGDGGYDSAHGNGSCEVDDVARVCPSGLSTQEGMGSSGSSVVPQRLMSRIARQALPQSHASAEANDMHCIAPAPQLLMSRSARQALSESRASVEANEVQRQSGPGFRPLAHDSLISGGVKRHMSPGGATPLPDVGQIKAVNGANDEVGYVGVVKKEPPAVVSLLEDERNGALDAGTRDAGADGALAEIQAGKLGAKYSQKKWRVELSSDSGIQFVPAPSGAFCIEGEGEPRYRFFGGPSVCSFGLRRFYDEFNSNSTPLEGPGSTKPPVTVKGCIFLELLARFKRAASGHFRRCSAPLYRKTFSKAL